MKTARGPRTRGLNHSTLTETGARVYRALALAGIEAQPGIINPRPSRGGARVVVTPEARRVRIAVAGEGHQQLHVYGVISPSAILAPLVAEFGTDAVTIRDTNAVWPADAMAKALAPPARSPD